MCQAKYIIAAIVAITLMGMHSFQQKFPDLSGPYLGQNPPGTSPQIDPLLDKYTIHDFTLAPDDKTLWFTSRKPTTGEGALLKSGNIWSVKRTESGWSEPKTLGEAINTDEHDSYPSVSRDGTLYFFSRRPGGKGKSDLYVSKLIDGKYLKSQNVGAPLNTEYHEWDPFITPDESYLIFCSTKPAGLGEDDLYISFRRENGAWSEPMNMGEKVNSSAAENRPYVTLDGKYFFFTSRKSGNREIYWVDAKIIEELKSEESK